MSFADFTARRDESKYSLVTTAQAAPAPTNGTASQPSADPKTNEARKRLASRAADSSVTAAAAPKAKKNKKATADADPPTPADDDDDDEIKDAAKPQPIVGDGQVAKSRDIAIPLDEGCPLALHTVYIDPSGVIFDASLNQTNASNNNNKFYRIQLLHRGNAGFPGLDTVGPCRRSRTDQAAAGLLLDDALHQFDSKFKSKSGLSWADRGEKPKPKSYTFIEKSYAVDSDEEEEAQEKDKGKEVGTYKPPTSLLQPAVQQLMQLIFNQQFFAAAMESLNYDVNKLPLGKLSKATITRGFQTLKDLSALLDDPALATTYGMSLPNAVESLSNSFYSYIPHAFGRNRPQSSRRSRCSNER